MSGVQLRPHRDRSLVVRTRRLRTPVGYVRNRREVPELRRAVSVDRMSRVREDLATQGVVSLAT